MIHKLNNSRLLARRGEDYRQRGCYAEALLDFTCAIELNPTYWWAIAHRGECYRQLKRFDPALADLTQAIRLAPDYLWAIAHRGVVYYQQKRLQEALDDLTYSIQRQPDYVWAVAYRVQVSITLKRYPEALLDVDQVIRLDRTIIPHWQGERGLLLNYLGRYQETIECCTQALQENPHDEVALYSLAVASALTKGRAQAEAEIRSARYMLEAMENREKSGLVLYRLGGLAALEGKTAAALNYLKMASTYSDEPGELARHDPAWHTLNIDGTQERIPYETKGLEFV